METTNKNKILPENNQNIIQNDHVYNKNAEYMNKICETLNVENYDSKKTIEELTNYIEDDCYYDRLMYSELSSYIYENKEEVRDMMNINAIILLDYIKADSGITEKLKKEAMRLCDHITLSTTQSEKIEKAERNAAENIAKMYKTVDDRVNSVQTNYITILGIFASIVLGAFGGFNYTFAILDKVSEENFICASIIGGAVIVLIIYILTRFIVAINNPKNNK